MWWAPSAHSTFATVAPFRREEGGKGSGQKSLIITAAHQHQPTASPPPSVHCRTQTLLLSLHTHVGLCARSCVPHPIMYCVWCAGTSCPSWRAARCRISCASARSAWQTDSPQCWQTWWSTEGGGGMCKHSYASHVIRYCIYYFHFYLWWEIWS